MLHARPFRESSLIVEVFSREHGRQGLVARGARGAKSRWRNILQPFRPLLLNWYQRGELGTLTGADQVASTPPLMGEPLLCGLYANELLMRLLQRADTHPELFTCYQNLLTCLSANEVTAVDAAADRQIQLRLFERDLLNSLGFGLQLRHEQGSGAPIEDEQWYLYQAESGAVARNTQQRGDSRQDSLVRGESLLALANGEIQVHHLRELKMMMRGLIQYRLGDKPLASHSLFRR